MPSRWVHAVIDLIAYGRPYFDLHEEKDKWYKTFGSNHRIIDHEWYQSYGRLWNFHVPFPSWLKESIRILGNAEGADKAEEQMARVDHDYIDRIWNDLSGQEKIYREGFFMWVLLNPKILKEWADVDVLKGRIQRIINGREVWESCPELKPEYMRLRTYVEAVKRNNKDLQDMVRRYGEKEYIPDFG